MNVQELRTSRDGLRFSHHIIENPAPAFSPTLFVSAAFQTMDSWARFARVFAQHTTVLLVDPPGMGESDLLPPDAGVDYLAACLAQVLDEHGIEKATVISASYGTPAAFTLAAQRPERVDRVVRRLHRAIGELEPTRRRLDHSIGGDRGLCGERRRHQGARASAAVAVAPQR